MAGKVSDETGYRIQNPEAFFLYDEMGLYGMEILTLLCLVVSLFGPITLQLVQRLAMKGGLVRVKVNES